ncbi:DNA-binding response regulator [Amycolatopsis sp. WAC 01375]|uniref:response regulator n=1 Tax=Amycolatopsis sp. WAC 01375 TaxID=2203194 RepID=UPI000F79E0EA|nr:response regulator transcription factor [Amycolatopsis sp. WAC 01375]RSM73991.1 DNA-binding response regulator [Amycolatopsis sp. WAC 01375]
MRETRIRVLIVEDHPITRDGVRNGLERDGRAIVVAEAADVPTACRMADQVRPDVALVDLSLRPHPEEPTGRGVGLIRHLRQRQPEVRVLVLSQAGPEELLAAIQAGAHGCVGKAATSAELTDAVAAVLTGPVLPAELAAHLIGELHRDARPLTTRERDVLRCLANGYDNREIAAQLRIAVRTVNRHLENIRDKLGRTRRSDLIRIARAQLLPWNSR